MARLLDARVRALQWGCRLSYLLRETWPAASSEHEVAKDRKWAHSGKYLRNDELEREKDEGHVRRLVIVLWCRRKLNIGNAWRCNSYGLLLPAEMKADPQPKPCKHGGEYRRALTVHPCKVFQVIGSARLGERS